MKTFVKISILSAVLLPLIASAAAVPGASATDLLGTVKAVLLFVIPILMILATVVFLWGIVMYVIAGGDEEKLSTAKGYIIAGIIGLFVMVAVWGIVQALSGSLGLTNVAIPPGPR